MDTTYVQDHHLPGHGEWNNEEQMGDPLHPSHGPLPDHFGEVACNGEHFLVSLWDTNDGNIHTMLEMKKEDSEDENVPLMSLDEVHHMRGWIAQFHTWKANAGYLTCRGHKVKAPEPYDPEDEWIRDCYRRIMQGSVRVAASEPIGAPTFLRVAKRIEASAKK